MRIYCFVDLILNPLCVEIQFLIDAFTLAFYDILLNEIS